MVNLIGIVAMDSEGGIGKNNTLPWPHNKEDMEWFKEVTNESIVVMGKNTWDSLPKKLSNRINVVISRETVDEADETIITKNDSIYYFMEEIAKIKMSYPWAKNVFLIGGKATYEKLNPMVDKWYITQIDQSFDCDTKLCKKSLTNDFSVVSYNQLNNKSTLEIYYRAKNKL